MQQEILTTWRMPTVRSLQLTHKAHCHLGFSVVVLPLLRVLFPADTAPAAPSPFPSLTTLDIDISEPDAARDSVTGCGVNFVELLALLPRIEASGIITLRAKWGTDVECVIMMRERQKLLWMDLHPDATGHGD